jgi:hypothetical protein
LCDGQPVALQWRVKPYYLIPWLAALPMTAQTSLFTFGLKGGVPAQTPTGQTTKMPFVLGPIVDVRISAGFSLETGVLFHRLGDQFNNAAYLYPQNSLTLTFDEVRTHAVEVPLLVKYHFLSEHRNWRPFVTAGPTIRATSLKSSYNASILSGMSTLTFLAQPGLNTKTLKWNVDPAVGAGVDFKTGRFHLEPSVQYSYWGAGKNSVIRKNQVEFLLGFRF